MSYRFPRWVANLDYGYLLPMISKLPLWAARPCWVARGVVNFMLDWDWRTFSLGHGYVRGATFRAMCALLRPHPKLPHPFFLTLLRFVCMSREEVDCLRLSTLDYSKVNYRVSGLEYLQQAQRDRAGVILVTAHFDSLYIGLVLMARAGLKINLMSTRITDDPSVPSAISNHFETKVSSLNRLLSPGQVRNHEDNMHYFVKALKRGEIVVIAGDGPATTSGRSQAVNFLGRKRYMSAGPQFLAQSTNSFLASYTNQLSSDGCFDISISLPTRLAEGGLQSAYSALEAQILMQPWRWWAADLMQAYAVESIVPDVS